LIFILFSECGNEIQILEYVELGSRITDKTFKESLENSLAISKYFFSKFSALGLFEQLQLETLFKQKDKASTSCLDLATSVGFDEIALQNSIKPLISNSML
jgi:hypothetical protein